MYQIIGELYFLMENTHTLCGENEFRTTTSLTLIFAAHICPVLHSTCARASRKPRHAPLGRAWPARGRSRRGLTARSTSLLARRRAFSCARAAEGVCARVPWCCVVMGCVVICVGVLCYAALWCVVLWCAGRCRVVAGCVVSCR